VITIREATAGDRAFILALADRLADFDRPPWRSAEEIADADRLALAAQLDAPSPQHALFVAELEGRAAGCLLMWTLEDYFLQEHHAHVSVIAVHDDMQRRGVGRALMEHAEAWARARGHRRITLSVFESNRRAQRLYEEAGFAVEMRRYVKVLAE
jgi:ribosomal protein S18 acetylase RimI-like enzyme